MFLTAVRCHDEHGGVKGNFEDRREVDSESFVAGKLQNDGDFLSHFFCQQIVGICWHVDQNIAQRSMIQFSPTASLPRPGMIPSA